MTQNINNHNERSKALAASGEAPNRDSVDLAPVEFINIGAWPTDENLVEKLGEIGLLGKDFIYSAVPSNRIQEVHEKGSYVKDESDQVTPIVFGCIYEESQGQIVQANNDDLTLKNYLTDNTDPSEDPVIAVYKADQLKHHCSAEFVFSNPQKATDALVALVRVKGL